MSSTAGKSIRLHFKGDKPEKKKKKKSSSHNHSDPDRKGKKKGKKRSVDGEDGESDVEDVGGNEKAWVSVERSTDPSGPTMICQASPSSSANAQQAHILSLNTTLSRVELTSYTPPSVGQDLSSIDQDDLDSAQIVEPGPSDCLLDLSPQDVNQVLVASRVLDSYDPPRYTFRTIENRYIGSDKYGSVLCSSEAKGPQEEWSIHTVPGKGILLQSTIHGGYLTLDEVAGGKKVLRVDQQESQEGGPSANVDHAMIWTMKVQWKFRHESRKGERAREIGKGGLAGMDKRLKMQETASTSKSSYDDGKMDKALKRATKEGRRAEELLNRRSKMRSDKFC
ncbi:unnamed protein product [Sympodiomycopsis kandeliae]